MIRTLRISAVALLCSAVLAACADSGGDRAGGAGAPTVLVMANNDGALLGAPAIARFVDDVERRSGGRLRIEVRDDWEGGGNEPRVLRDAISGAADLGWSGSRAFDEIGITAFRPLQVPFLVSSYAAQAAVVRDPVATDMLASTRTHGLVSLALLADQLRMVAATDRPVLAPADLRGMQIGVVPSRQGSTGIAALGAAPRPLARPTGSQLEGLDGVETMWWTYDANEQAFTFPYVSSDLVLWPRTTVVVANPARFDALDDTQRGWLLDAAADATAWSAEHAADAVAGQAARACQDGAQLAQVGPTGLAAFRAAAEPAYQQLRSDPDDRGRLARIEALVAGVQPSTEPLPAIPDSCAYRPAPPA